MLPTRSLLPFFLAPALLASAASQAAMGALDNDSLSRVTGQAGISLRLDLRAGWCDWLRLSLSRASRSRLAGGVMTITSAAVVSDGSTKQPDSTIPSTGSFPTANAGDIIVAWLRVVSITKG